LGARPAPRTDPSVSFNSLGSWLGCERGIARQALRLGARDPARLARSGRLCVRGVLRWPRSPCPGRFPPPPPRPLARPCSAGSRVLPACPTSHDRASQAYGLGLPRAARPATTKTGRHQLSRFSRPETPHMPGLFDRAGSADSSRIAPPAILPSARTHGVGTPDCINFAAPYPRLRVPLPTLRRRPRERPTHGSGPSWLATPSM
jgi:hypothetical protein